MTVLRGPATPNERRKKRTKRRLIRFALWVAGGLIWGWAIYSNIT